MSTRDLMKDSGLTTLSELVEKLSGPLMDSLVEQGVSPAFYPTMKPVPRPSRRTRVYRSLRKWLWYHPWAAAHRYLPGQCDCDCGDDY